MLVGEKEKILEGVPYGMVGMPNDCAQKGNTSIYYYYFFECSLKNKIHPEVFVAVGNMYNFPNFFGKQKQI